MKSNATRKSERGTALMFALVVLVILSTGTALLWKQLHDNLAQQRRSWHQEQAFQLAEAGLERAVAELRVAPDTFRGCEETALGSGTYEVKVQPGGESDACKLSGANAASSESAVSLTSAVFAAILFIVVRALR